MIKKRMTLRKGKIEIQYSTDGISFDVYFQGNFVIQLDTEFYGSGCEIFELNFDMKRATGFVREFKQELKGKK